MLQKPEALIAAALIFFFTVGLLPAQTTTTTTKTTTTSTTKTEPDPNSKAFDMSDFPLFAKDIRRFEIVAFGSLPFTIFAATFFMDLSRYMAHEQDVRYAPWPFKTAGAKNMSSDDYMETFLYATYASLGIAFFDGLIFQIRRAVDKRRAARNVSPSRVEIDGLGAE